MKMDTEIIDLSRSLKHQIGYGIGHVLNDLCASLWFTYFLVFFHLVLGFSAAQAGILMLIGQVADAITTPFIGYHSDHTDNSISAYYGRRKLWHLFGSVCVVGSFPFILSECLGCSSTHKWAQMFYFTAFIVIFQIGWAAVQISHLSLIPELSSDDHVRTHLTAVRYGFTVFSNLFVYVITWIILKVTGDCDNEQVGPGDAWKFKQVVYISISLGTITSVIFHMIVRERPHRTEDQLLQYTDNVTHCNFLRKPLLYQVAGIYMSTRVVANVSQVLIPLYLHRSLGLAARALAVVPLAMYLGSLMAAGVQRMAPRSVTRKHSYTLGTASALIGYLWIALESDDMYKTYYIYVVAVFIGFGSAVMVVTSLSLTADLVGASTEASAFVYGLMSFTDKLACGLAIAGIQLFADNGHMTYYQEALSWVCGAASVLGLVLTLLLPKFTPDTVILIDNPSINSMEEPTLAQRDAL